jgi:hypothetical protein
MSLADGDDDDVVGGAGEPEEDDGEDTQKAKATEGVAVQTWVRLQQLYVTRGDEALLLLTAVSEQKKPGTPGATAELQLPVSWQSSQEVEL